MPSLMDSVRSHCADIPPGLLEMHFRRLPAAYFDRYAPTDIARHLRLLSSLSEDHPVEVEIRPLASHTFEVSVVGIDRTGTVACITAALAAYGLNLEDVQVATYLATDAESAAQPEPPYFIVLLRVSGNLRGRTPGELAEELSDRLRVAFSYLDRGDILEAQTVAADTRLNRTEVTRLTPHQPSLSPVQPAPEASLVGADFRLQRKLAIGGMSEVHLATQISLNRTVVVKLIRHEVAPDDDLVARFSQEAMVLAQFNSPYIVQIFAAGTLPGHTDRMLGWMAMEYMAGGDLAHWQRQHGCPPPELAARWLREALEGLLYAHRHAVLHRDIKPHNLLLTEEGHVKVSDFGLLKQAQPTPGGLTPHAAIVGTPHYMSPEQALGEPVDERSDIFSLGTTFFHLLSGRLPFDKNSMTAVLIQIAGEDAPRLADVAPQVPLPLAVVIGRMLARRREERYQDISVILEDLASYERRGLLRISESGVSFIPAKADPAVAEPGEETQAYKPANDVVKD